MPALPQFILLAAAVLAPSDDTEWTVPAGLHLSSFDTTLAARLDHTGAVDSGAAVLRLVDPDSGKALPASGVMYGPEVMAYPDLWGTWTVPGDGVDVSVRALAGATSRNGDERLRVAVRVVLENPSDESVTTRVALQLSAGGSDPQRRPLVSTPFAPGTTFTREGALILRDGTAVLGWQGADPEVVVHPAPETPDAPAVTLTWSRAVPARSANYVDVFLAGPPTAPNRNEAALRAALTELDYLDLEERARWQSEKRGTVATIGTAFKDLDKTLCASLHFLRSLGDANASVERLTDRPYGYPATDAAVPAEILATFFEFGLGAFAEAFLDEQIAAAQAMAASLPPARRVALVHALTRCARVGVDDGRARRVAALVPALVTEAAAVPVWADPDLVRADLALILERGDPEHAAERAAALPELRWAEPVPGSIEAEMQAVRRALSAHDAPAAWDACLQLMAGTNANGLGAMQVEGDLDGGYAIGTLALLHEMLVDDHGPDLHLLPAFGSELLYERNAMHFPPLHSRFGVADLKMYRHVNARLAFILTMIKRADPELLFVHMPAGERARRIMDVTAGRARLMPDGSIATVIDPLFTIGVNVVVRLEDGLADTDEGDGPEDGDGPDDGSGEGGGFR